MELFQARRGVSCGVRSFTGFWVAGEQEGTMDRKDERLVSWRDMQCLDNMLMTAIYQAGSVAKVIDSKTSRARVKYLKLFCLWKQHSNKIRNMA